MEKKELFDYSLSIMYDLDGKSLTDCIAYLNECLDGFSKRDNFSRAAVAFEDGYDTDLVINIYRLETDKEFNKRKLANEKSKARAKIRKQKADADLREQELKVLKKLQKKYPDSA